MGLLPRGADSTFGEPSVDSQPCSDTLDHVLGTVQLPEREKQLWWCVMKTQ